jgi:hypothetical protein
MHLYGRPIGPYPRVAYTQGDRRSYVGAAFGPGALPNAGDVNGYLSKGNDLLKNANSAIQGNASAVAGLVADGVTVISRTAGGSSPVGTIAVDILGGAISGFAMGGPVGAVGGALAGMAAAAQSLSGGGSAQGGLHLDAGGKAVQMHLLNWRVPNEDVALNPSVGGPNPVGWALYDYMAQVAARAPSMTGQPGRGLSIATPFLWGFDPNLYGVANLGSFTENGDDPHNAAAYHQHAVSTIAILPGMSDEASLAYAVKRGPPPVSYSARLPNKLLMPELINAGFTAPDDSKADAFLGLATIFGMLNQGALARSIASELMMQQAIWAELVPAHVTSPEAKALLDYYVTLAQTEPTPAPQVNPAMFASLGNHIHVFAQPPPPPSPTLAQKLGAMHLGITNLAAVATSPRSQWVSHYLALTPGSG